MDCVGDFPNDDTLLADRIYRKSLIQLISMNLPIVLVIMMNIKL